MTQPTAGGTLRAQQAGELQDWVRVHAVLKGTNRFCYHQPEDTDTGEEPLFTAVINKETQVQAGELDQAVGRPFTLGISNQYGEDEGHTRFRQRAGEPCRAGRKLCGSFSLT